MCNIAGYVGEKNATEILLKMLTAQEGIDCGFYTGIAIHDGKNLNYRKTVGDIKTLLDTTNASSLKGKTGLIHSRTPSGGGVEYAHPFISVRGNEIEQCYVANGSVGAFSYNKEAYSALANELYLKGYEFTSRAYIENSKFNKLGDGYSVHSSDILCQIIYKNKRNGENTVDAITNAFYEMPKEAIGLLIEKDTPNVIYFSRVNMPMFVGFDESGAYLASMPYAFPSSVKEYKLLPALSSGVIYKDKIVIKKYQKFHDKVRRFTKKTVENVTNILLKELENGAKDFNDLRKMIRPLMKNSKLTQTNVLAYVVLTKLLNENKIYFTKTVSTVGELTAPKLLINKK